MPPGRTAEAGPGPTQPFAPAGPAGGKDRASGQCGARSSVIGGVPSTADAAMQSDVFVHEAFGTLEEHRHWRLAMEAMLSKVQQQQQDLREQVRDLNLQRQQQQREHEVLQGQLQEVRDQLREAVRRHEHHADQLADLREHRRDAQQELKMLQLLAQRTTTTQPMMQPMMQPTQAGPEQQLRQPQRPTAQGLDTADSAVGCGQQSKRAKQRARAGELKAAAAAIAAARGKAPLLPVSKKRPAPPAFPSPAHVLTGKQT